MTGPHRAIVRVRVRVLYSYKIWSTSTSTVLALSNSNPSQEVPPPGAYHTVITCSRAAARCINRIRKFSRVRSRPKDAISEDSKIRVLGSLCHAAYITFFCCQKLQRRLSRSKASQRDTALLWVSAQRTHVTTSSPLVPGRLCAISCLFGGAKLQNL